MNQLRHSFNGFFRTAFLMAIVARQPGPRLSAADYFLTIGGGYNRSGNQASLEANVVFFQQVLDEKHGGTRRHDIYFADGHDSAADLQILAPKPSHQDLPATELIATLHRRRGQEHVTYRNHRVPEIAGSLDPELVRTSLESMAKRAHPDDRLIIFVTAHGSGGPKEDAYNTTIDCWNERKNTAREFTGWLNKLPPDLPVVMVMAQCYCGGFAHTIFDDLDESKGLAPQLRAGFFAQQHNLPAAGCRPDIEHDEEFSSYFWGAIAGRSRNGVPIEGCDVDANGLISFAEAFAYAVTSGETIDIPLRTSDVLLRTYSRMSAVKSNEPAGTSEADSDSNKPTESPANPASNETTAGQANQSSMSGTLQSFVDQGRPVSGQMVTKLSKVLGFALTDDAATVLKAFNEHRKSARSQGRGRGGGGRGRRGSGRRDLLKEVSDKWPELGDERHWEESPLLNPDNQEKLLAELKELPGWKAYSERRKQMEAAGDQSEQHELRAVKFRRLINTLETIVLEKNLPTWATPGVVERYRQLLALEESNLQATPR